MGKFLRAKPWIWVAATILAVFLTDRGLAAALGLVVGGSGQRFSQALTGRTEADILVLGNSRGVNGLLAPELERMSGKRVFNLSYNGMSMVLCEALLRDWIERQGKPDTLLLEVTAVHSGHDLLNDLKLFARYSEPLKNLLRQHYPRAYTASQLSHLFRYNGELFLRLLYYALRGEGDQNWINEGTVNPAFARDLVLDVEERSAVGRIAQGNLDALGRITELCAAKGIRAVFVVSPYLPRYGEQIVDAKAFMNTLQAAVGDGVVILDYSDALAETRLFSDPVHLNRAGSKAFLRLLIEDGIVPVAVQP